MTRTQDEWEARYVDGELPWDTNHADSHLVDLMASRPLRPGRALEIGCGTGTNAVWLAKQGFTVTACDIAPTAITRAGERAREAGVIVSWHTGDFVADGAPGNAFDFAFDRGCFHSFDEADARARFARRVHDLLTEDGLWFSLIGSTDGPPREVGPPRRSARDIAFAIESHFEILSLTAALFDSDRPPAARAWKALMRKRRPADRALPTP
jgi:SAM-dependent methyltransferase